MIYIENNDMLTFSNIGSDTGKVTYRNVYVLFIRGNLPAKCSRFIGICSQVIYDFSLIATMTSVYFPELNNLSISLSI